MNQESNLYAIFRGMIRQEIDQTPGFRELTARSDYPANLDAERAIIGAALLDGVLADVLAEEFSLESHRLIWTAMLEMGAQIDIVTLAEHLGQQRVKEVGGVAYLASLSEGVPTRLNTASHAAIVREKAKLRRIWAACEKAIESCREQVESAEKIVADLGIALKGIRAKNKEGK